MPIHRYSLTFPVKDEGNSASNLLLSPNLQKQKEDHIKIINNPNPCHKLQAPHNISGFVTQQH